MSWPRVFATRLRSLFLRKRLDRRLDDEVRFHLEKQTEDNLQAGMSPVEARHAALRSFGGVEPMKEQYRDRRTFVLFDTIAQDLRYALRMMRRNPVFSLTAIITLALGIGANTAIFSLLYGLILRSMPVSRPSELVRIDIVLPAQDQESSPVWGMYQQILRQQHAFSQMSAWVPGHYEVMADRDGTPRRYNVTLVNGEGFQVLGIKPYIGRLLEPYDDVRAGPAQGWTTVLSYSFWVERFGGDPAIVGKPIRVGNSFVTVVGVAPSDFQGVTPGLNPALYLPFQMHSLLESNSRDLDYGCNVIARLAPGASLNTANAELAVLPQKDIFDRFLPPGLVRSAGFTGAYLHVASARAGLAWFTRDYRQPLFLMQALVGVVLLLCCVNVGGLMMSKAYARQHEFAIRKAIGGGRLRLTRQYFLESFLIALAGGTLGAIASWFGSAALASFFVSQNSNDPLNVHPDTTIFLVTVGLAVCATVFFGILPAWHVGQSDPGALLTSRTTFGGRRQIAGRAFVPVQVALSLVLVTAAILLSQSLIRLRTEHLGFDAAHVSVQPAPFYHRLPQKDDDTFLDVYQQIVDRLEQSPGIQSAAITGNMPTEKGLTSRFQAVGSQAETLMSWNHVGPGYFRTMQTRILFGREFNRRERERTVCVVNESAAKNLFSNEPPIGQLVISPSGDKKLPTAPCQIIGVAEDAKSRDFRQPAPPTIYFPVTKEAIPVHGNFTFLIRAAHETDSIAAYRQAASEIVPEIPVLRSSTLQQQIDDVFGRERLITIMINFFGVLALLLSAIGLYGLLSFSVTQRTGEIGVRLALGARHTAVQWMILKEGVILLAAGILLGLAGLYGMVRFIQKMLYQISAFDPATLFMTITILAAVAFLAAFFPALRASRVDPMVALRHE